MFDKYLRAITEMANGFQGSPITVTVLEDNKHQSCVMHFKTFYGFKALIEKHKNLEVTGVGSKEFYVQDNHNGNMQHTVQVEVYEMWSDEFRLDDCGLSAI